MRYYPLFQDTQSIHVLIIGGDEEALAKLRLISKTQAKISLYAPEFDSSITEFINDNKNVELIIGSLDLNSIALYGYDLIYIAIDDVALAKELAIRAKRMRIAVNVVDQPDYCSFITPAIVERGPMTIAIGSEGQAPTLARLVKTKIEAMLPSKLGTFIEYANNLKPIIENKLKNGLDRRHFWQAFYTSHAQNQFYQKDSLSLQKTVDELINQQSETDKIGSVSFVGAGPGDPELLTLKAVRKLQEADVIIVDQLVSDEVLELARRDAKRIYVGKIPSYKNDDIKSISQEEINNILVEQAQSGQNVVRLKGGDPLIYGRIIEEITALDGAHIAYEIVPGITAAFACAANAKLPLTSRAVHRSFSIITGHDMHGLPDYDWSSLAKQPMAIYMGVKNSELIRQQLLQAGLSKQTAITIVENGSRVNQKILVATLDNFTQAMQANKIQGPSVIYIGLKPLASEINHQGAQEDVSTLQSHHLFNDFNEVESQPLALKRSA